MMENRFKLLVAATAAGFLANCAPTIEAPRRTPGADDRACSSDRTSEENAADILHFALSATSAESEKQALLNEQTQGCTDGEFLGAEGRLIDAYARTGSPRAKEAADLVRRAHVYRLGTND